MKKAYKFIFISLLFSSCAYFNTFYNAKRYYNKAYDEIKKNRTDPISATSKSNFQKATEKAQKILSLYPDSKYLDDALLLLGKSYYFQGMHLEAQRRLSELIDGFPKSEFINEARLWYAKSDIALRDYRKAELELNDLIALDIDDELKGEAQFYLANVYESSRDFNKAIEGFEKAVNWISNEMKAETYLKIGASHDSLGQFQLAGEAFQKVLKSNPGIELRFDAQFRYARMQKKLRNYDRAIQLFEKLSGDERNQKHLPELRIEIAECLKLKSDIDGAMTTYQDVTQDHQKSVHSARAYYELGKIYEENKKNYQRALENYLEVRKESRQSPYADSADVNSRDIQRLQALHQVITMAIRGEEGEGVNVGDIRETTGTDTLLRNEYSPFDTTRMDTTDWRFRQAADTLNQNRYIPVDPQDMNQQDMDPQNLDRRTDEINQYADRQEYMQRTGGVNRYGTRPGEREIPKVVENPELKTFRKEELDKNYFLLAELYLFRFSLPDTAVRYYRKLIDAFPESPYTPQAYYNLAYISEMGQDAAGADTSYHILTDRYPLSVFADVAREKMGLSGSFAAADSVKRLFEKAEEALFGKKEPETSYKIFQTILSDCSDSRFQARALYSLGWLQEMVFDSLELAFVFYDSLMRTFPESAYAGEVKSKVEFVRQENQKTRQVAPAQGAVRDSLLSPVKRSETEPSSPADTMKAAIPQEKTVQRKREPDESAQEKESEGILDAFPLEGVDAIRQSFQIPEGKDRNALKPVVILQVGVDEKGLVVKADIVQGSNDTDVDALIIEAVKRAPFQPAMQDEHPVFSTIRLSIPVSDDIQHLE